MDAEGSAALVILANLPLTMRHDSPQAVLQGCVCLLSALCRTSPLICVQHGLLKSGFVRSRTHARTHTDLHTSPGKATPACSFISRITPGNREAEVNAVFCHASYQEKRNKPALKPFECSLKTLAKI